MDASTITQFLEEINAVFDKMDANGDGKIDKEEFLNCLVAEGGPTIPEEGMTQFEEFLASCDTDEDGKVSRAEFTAFFEYLMEQLYTNLDNPAYCDSGDDYEHEHDHAHAHGHEDCEHDHAHDE